MRQAGAGVRAVLARPDFRRLLGTRLLSQGGDGVFQAALAGTVLFNPQRAADPVDVAAAFAVLLLPYSLVGPFAGVWLDRWSRRAVLLRANVLRAGLVCGVAVLIAAGVQGTAFYGAGLVVFAVNRFILAALSAGLPHTTDALVPANALSTTSGSVAAVVGGGAALGLLQLTGSDDAGYAVVAAAAALPYLAAAAVVSGFAPAHLGPDAAAPPATVRAVDVVRGMAAGARHAWARPPVAAALAVMAVHRLAFGLFTLLTLLLYRNTFSGEGWLFPGGLAGLGQLAGAIAAGSLLAAVATPPAVRRVGPVLWTAGLLLASAVVHPLLVLAFRAPAAIAGALLLGFAGQAVKICVDATVQQQVDDDFRGRVFSVYDTVFNVGFVVAVVGAAFLLPASGVSEPAAAVLGVLYLLAVAAYLGLRRRSGTAVPV